MTEQELQQYLLAQQQMHDVQVQKDREARIAEGRAKYGSAAYDDAEATLGAKLTPEEQAGFDTIVRENHYPHDLVMALAADERKIEGIKRSPAVRSDLARIESNLHPTLPATGSELAWKKTAKSPNKILNDDEWGSGMANSLSEAQWQRNFEKRQERRATQFPQPLGGRRRG